MKILKKQLSWTKVVTRGVLLFLLVLLILASATVSWSQTRIVERTTKLVEVYNDTLAGATTKVIKPSAAHSGWIAVGAYQTFAAYVKFTDPGSIGFTSADTVKVLMEQWGSTTQPTSGSTGYFEATAAGTVPTRETIVTYDSTNTTLPTFISFHGTGDPEIALATYVRFYSTVIGGFTGAGLTMQLIFARQP